MPGGVLAADASASRGSTRRPAPRLARITTERAPPPRPPVRCHPTAVPEPQYHTSPGFRRLGQAPSTPLLSSPPPNSDASAEAILTAARLTAKRDWLMSELAAKDAQLAGLEAVLAEAAGQEQDLLQPGVALLEPPAEVAHSPHPAPTCARIHPAVTSVLIGLSLLCAPAGSVLRVRARASRHHSTSASTPSATWPRRSDGAPRHRRGLRRGSGGSCA